MSLVWVLITIYTTFHIPPAIGDVPSVHPSNFEFSHRSIWSPTSWRWDKRRYGKGHVRHSCRDRLPFFLRPRWTPLWIPESAGQRPCNYDLCSISMKQSIWTPSHTYSTYVACIIYLSWLKLFRGTFLQYFEFNDNHHFIYTLIYKKFWGLIYKKL